MQCQGSVGTKVFSPLHSPSGHEKNGRVVEWRENTRHEDVETVPTFENNVLVWLRE